jgi:predicted house-cleaning noncanonical NTP pyrophosphatase (MazG superfamily)
VSSHSHDAEKEDLKASLRSQLEKEIKAQIDIKFQRNEFDKHDYLKMIQEIRSLLQ